MRASQWAECELSDPRNPELIAAGRSKKGSRYSGASGLIEDTICIASKHGQEITALILAKTPTNRVARFGQGNLHAHSPGHRHLGQRDKQPAIGNVGHSVGAAGFD